MFSIQCAVYIGRLIVWALGTMSLELYKVYVKEGEQNEGRNSSKLQ